MRRTWRGFVSRPVPAIVRWATYAGACTLYVLILFLRGGPNPAELDARSVTLPTTAISHGDLRSAARATAVPNPPGYPLITAPVVAALRPLVGASRWCDDKPIPQILRGPGAAYFRSVLSPCPKPGAHPVGPQFPHWYHSQAVLVVLGWLTLVAGAVLLLRAAGAGGGVGELLLVGALSILPTASDTVAETFHPQDLMCVGFIGIGLAQAIRRRWVAAGLIFGLAFLCKQFAALPLLAVVAAAPAWRARLLVVLPAAGIVMVGVTPFYLVDPVDTAHAVTAVYVAGAGIVKTPTVVGSLSIAEQLKLDIARDAPLLVAGALALWAWWRARDRLLAPGPLVGLALACLATRLAFEVALFDYYLLAVGALALILDFTLQRVPWRSIAWIVLTRFGLSPHVAALPSTVSAALFLLASLVAIGIGLAAVPARSPPAVASSRSRTAAQAEAVGPTVRGVALR